MWRPACRICWDNSKFMHPLQQLQNHPAQLVVPLAILAGLIVRSVVFRIVRAWAAGTESNLVDMIVESLPVVLWSLILGLHLATQNSEIPRQAGWRATWCGSTAAA